MDPEIKTRWVAALRSGEFEQATGLLKSCSGYCCLGVLTELYVQETGAEWEERVPFNSTVPSSFELEGEGGVLHEAVQKWAGLTKSPTVVVPMYKIYKTDPDLAEDEDYDTEEKGVYSLVRLNDDYKFNFGEIADLIEEQF